VYAVRVRIDEYTETLPGNHFEIPAPLPEITYQGMMNIGVRPTIDNSARRVIEVNLFNFDRDIYGRQLTVFVKKMLRPEQKFNGLDALKAQLAKDKQHALDLFHAPDPGL
jgi:riboflavin kinase/FMN adenylyltransferase